MNIEYYWVGNEYPTFLNSQNMETTFSVFIQFNCGANSVNELLDYVGENVGDNYIYILIKINNKFEFRLYNKNSSFSPANETVFHYLNQFYKFSEEDELLFDDIYQIFDLDTIFTIIMIGSDIDIYPMNIDTLHKFIDIPLDMNNFAFNVFNIVSGEELAQIISATINERVYYDKDNNYLFKIVFNKE